MQKEKNKSSKNCNSLTDTTPGLSEGVHSEVTQDYFLHVTTSLFVCLVLNDASTLVGH